MTVKAIDNSPRRVLQNLDLNRSISTPTLRQVHKQKTEKHVIDIKRENVKPTQANVSVNENAGEPSKDEMKARFDAVCWKRVGGDVDCVFNDLDMIPWSVEDFEFVRKLGAGGAANVYCAREIQSGYQVALKVQEDDEDGLREVDIHLQLEHTNIVNMIDYFFADSAFDPDATNESGDGESSKGYLYIIMELCDGGSLHELIGEAQNCCLNEELASALFLNALDAMEYLHNRDIIHCDCKPANFLVHRNQLRLADFGMAVHDDEKEVIGATPVYMAPEHLLAWRHMTNDFDKRSDIYSLGVVLYEMILGYLPFETIEADTDEESLSKDHFRGTTASSSSTEILLETLPTLTLNGDDEEFETPVLDLRKLNDQSEDAPFYIPPPIFPPTVSEEAQDLILKLMEPSLRKRISISNAKKHPWFRKHNAIAC